MPGLGIVIGTGTLFSARRTFAICATIFARLQRWLICTQTSAFWVRQSKYCYALTTKRWCITPRTIGRQQTAKTLFTFVKSTSECLNSMTRQPPASTVTPSPARAFWAALRSFYLLDFLPLFSRLCTNARASLWPLMAYLLLKLRRPFTSFLSLLKFLLKRLLLWLVMTFLMLYLIGLIVRLVSWPARIRASR